MHVKLVDKYNTVLFIYFHKNLDHKKRSSHSQDLQAEYYIPWNMLTEIDSKFWDNVKKKVQITYDVSLSANSRALICIYIYIYTKCSCGHVCKQLCSELARLRNIRHFGFILRTIFKFTYTLLTQSYLEKLLPGTCYLESAPLGLIRAAPITAFPHFHSFNRSTHGRNLIEDRESIAASPKILPRKRVARGTMDTIVAQTMRN